MLKIDSSIVLQNINMLTRQLFLLVEKSTTFWDNPRTVGFERRRKRKNFFQGSSETQVVFSWPHIQHIPDKIGNAYSNFFPFSLPFRFMLFNQ